MYHCIHIWWIMGLCKNNWFLDVYVINMVRCGRECGQGGKVMDVVYSCTR